MIAPTFAVTLNDEYVTGRAWSFIQYQVRPEDAPTSSTIAAACAKIGIRDGRAGVGCLKAHVRMYSRNAMSRNNFV